MTTFEAEVRGGKRFEFGRNWRAFLSTLTEERIAIAEDSIGTMLGVNDLGGKRVLDVGSGSGLFSLAARRLGAEVHSFDYDPASAACTRELRARYFPDDGKWAVSEGSVLDKPFVASLGRFDVVYSWGVLHHTGQMRTALENAASCVADGGILFIALYNDQGWKSRFWWRVKKTYCSGIAGRLAVSFVFIPGFFLRAVAASVLKRENVFAAYKKNRGMSIVYDWFDWLGGFPFEVASVEAVFHFYRERGFDLANLTTTKSLGNNQFVFVRRPAGPRPSL